MRMIVDANILVSAILGQPAAIREALVRGLVLMVPDAQVAEAVGVLTRLLNVARDDARSLVADLVADMVVIALDDLDAFEERAVQRLEARGRPDWPVLASAMMLDAHIWSRDRDFFGVGVPVWSSRNIRYAYA